MPRSAPLALAAVLTAGALAAPAQAAIPKTVLATGNDVALVSGNAIDVDSAPDGHAVGVWLQQDGGVNHVFAARFTNGAWGPAARVDTGLATPSGPPQVGVGNGGETVIVFPNGAAGNERLVAVTAPNAATALGAPVTVQGDTPGWARVDVDVASNGDGYVVAHETKHLWAYRVVNGAFTAVGAGYPGAGGILNVNPAEEAGIDTQRAGKVSVDAAGSSAVVAWTEGSGGNYKLFARKLTGSAPTDIGGAVDGGVPTLQGRPVATTGQDEISLATGGGKTWVAFRANYTYPNGGGTVDRARLLARTFDGTTFGAPQILDNVPADPGAVTEGAEFPVIAVNDAGQGVASSHTQVGNEGVIAAMTGGTWSPGTLVPGTYDVSSTAITASGVGAGLYLDQATGRILSARIVGGTANGTSTAISDPADGPIFTTAQIAASGDGAVVLWRQGQAAGSKILAGRFDLPPTPTATPTPTPSPTTPALVFPNLTNVRLSASRIKRANKRPVVLTSRAKGPSLRFTVDRPARITIAAERIGSGRVSSSGQCERRTSKNAGRRACSLFTPAGQALILDRPAGTTRIRFTGRLGGQTALRAGTYRLSLTAADAATGGVTIPPTRVRVTLR